MNEILHSVTNRAGGWTSPALPPVTNFVPDIPRASADKLRRITGLTPDFPDYYTIAMLNIVDAHPHIRAEFKETGLRTYNTALHVRARDGFDPPSAFLRTNKDGPQRLLREASEWPVRFDITVTNVGDGALCRVEVGGAVHMCPYRHGGGYLTVTWPEGSGIFGRMALDTWSDGDIVRMSHEPVKFPVRLMLEAATAVTEFHTLMNITGLASRFPRAVDPYEKAAYLYLAIGLSNKSVYP